MMDLLLATSGGEAQAASGGYVDDVFSAYTYTGNGSTQTINNGIDLAGKGGLVWIKKRTNAVDTNTLNHWLFDSLRGNGVSLSSNSTGANNSVFTGLIPFSGNGFSVNTADSNLNGGDSYISWTFRKAPKFFDVVTYTGDGVAGRQIPHSLGIAPGMIIFKCTSLPGYDWATYHIAAGNDRRFRLNTTQPPYNGSDFLNYTNPTTTNFTVGSDADGVVNQLGNTYVAYLFAHDPSAEGIIQFGSFATDASGNATVNLGWEPQFSMVKASSTTSDWIMLDSMRGWNMSANDATLLANTSGAETVATERGNPTATGFDFKGGAASQTYIYLAIRRPNKPPTSGTQVYNAIARTGTGAAATVTGVGFAPDWIWMTWRGLAYGGKKHDRLRGFQWQLMTDQTGREFDSGTHSFDVARPFQDGFTYGANANLTNELNGSGTTSVNHFFRRAPKVFDVVCDSGTGVAHGITHGLSATPEFIIRKSRSGSTQWECWHSALTAAEKLVLNSTAAKATDTAAWNSTLPTATQFTVGTGANVNANAATFVTYLFATLAGISKVGSYTGNGTSQTINCGFASGARFILIKRTDATGDWYVWDSVRGIIAANDPHLSLNTAAAEVTTDDSVDPDASGYIVNQNTATNINVSGGQYIFLAIA